MAAPDYSDLFASDKLSDVTIVIAEESLQTSDTQSGSEKETQGPSKRCKLSGGQEGAAAAAAAEPERKSDAASAAGSAADAAIAAGPEAGTAVAAEPAADAVVTAVPEAGTAVAAGPKAGTAVAAGSAADAAVAAGPAAGAAVAAGPEAGTDVAAEPAADAAVAATAGDEPAAGAGAGGSSSSTKVLPGHMVVLYGCSSLFNAQLDRWSSSSRDGQPEIRILVPKGQVAIGELLVQCIYAAQPDLSACSQVQWLQLLMLADRYHVQKVVAAVTTAFHSLNHAAFKWETVPALYGLPNCVALGVCKGVVAAVGEKLQHELGDLELALADAEKCRRLMWLPQPALLQLLRDSRTRVASENTVYRVINSWLLCWKQKMQERLQHVADGQERLWLKRLAQQTLLRTAQELMQQVRMQHCTPLFVSTDMPRAELAKVCLSLAQMADASALVFAANSNMPQQALAPLREGSAAINKYPAWTAAKRPASAMQQLEMQWCLPLQQLKELGTTHLSRAAEQPGEAFTSSTGSGKQTWQGQSFVLALQMTSYAAAPRKTSIGLYLCMPRLQPCVVRSVEYQLCVVAAPVSNPQPALRAAWCLAPPQTPSLEPDAPWAGLR
uniref:BTB domain-containing protein n=1 Tax=Tetradesmus obliquus TaxID=3088 RepID=A0A383VAU3_TETOB|eukprot:jgi/Sobl393_1/18735/SZX62687.1